MSSPFIFSTPDRALSHPSTNDPQAGIDAFVLPPPSVPGQPGGTGLFIPETIEEVPDLIPPMHTPEPASPEDALKDSKQVRPEDLKESPRESEQDTRKDACAEPKSRESQDALRADAANPTDNTSGNIRDPIKESSLPAESARPSTSEPDQPLAALSLARLKSGLSLLVDLPFRVARRMSHTDIADASALQPVTPDPSAPSGSSSSSLTSPRGLAPQGSQQREGSLTVPGTPSLGSPLPVGSPDYTTAQRVRQHSVISTSSTVTPFENYLLLEHERCPQCGVSQNGYCANHFPWRDYHYKHEAKQSTHSETSPLSPTPASTSASTMSTSQPVPSGIAPLQVTSGNEAPPSLTSPFGLLQKLNTLLRKFSNTVDDTNICSKDPSQQGRQEVPMVDGIPSIRAFARSPSVVLSDGPASPGRDDATLDFNSPDPDEARDRVRALDTQNPLFPMFTRFISTRLEASGLAKSKSQSGSSSSTASNEINGANMEFTLPPSAGARQHSTGHSLSVQTTWSRSEQRAQAGSVSPSPIDSSWPASDNADQTATQTRNKLGAATTDELPHSDPRSSQTGQGDRLKLKRFGSDTHVFRPRNPASSDILDDTGKRQQPHSEEPQTSSRTSDSTSQPQIERILTSLPYISGESASGTSVVTNYVMVAGEAVMVPEIGSPSESGDSSITGSRLALTRASSGSVDRPRPRSMSLSQPFSNAPSKRYVPPPPPNITPGVFAFLELRSGALDTNFGEGESCIAVPGVCYIPRPGKQNALGEDRHCLIPNVHRFSNTKDTYLVKLGRSRGMHRVSLLDFSSTTDQNDSMEDATADDDWLYVDPNLENHPPRQVSSESALDANEQQSQQQTEDTVYSDSFVVATQPFPDSMLWVSEAVQDPSNGNNPLTRASSASSVEEKGLPESEPTHQRTTSTSDVGNGSPFSLSLRRLVSPSLQATAIAAAMKVPNTVRTVLLTSLSVTSAVNSRISQLEHVERELLRLLRDVTKECNLTRTDTSAPESDTEARAVTLRIAHKLKSCLNLDDQLMQLARAFAKNKQAQRHLLSRDSRECSNDNRPDQSQATLPTRKALLELDGIDITFPYAFVAVADGVGGWSNTIGDGSCYSTALVDACHDIVHIQTQLASLLKARSYRNIDLSKIVPPLPHPKTILTSAYEAVNKLPPTYVQGSTTACIVTIDCGNPVLRCANLGDSGFLVSRVVLDSSKASEGTRFPRRTCSICHQSQNPRASTSLAANAYRILNRYSLFEQSSAQPVASTKCECALWESRLYPRPPSMRALSSDSVDKAPGKPYEACGPGSARRYTAARSGQQHHRFNCPFQLGLMSDDHPCIAEDIEIPLRKGDVVVIGSDGIFDNLYDAQIHRIIDHELSAASLPPPPYSSRPFPYALPIADGELPPDVVDSNIPALSLPALANSIAAHLARKAQEFSKETRYLSPYGITARAAHKEVPLGGKQDDITVVVYLIL